VPPPRPAVLAGIDVAGTRKVPVAEVIAVAGLELGQPADMQDEAFHERLEQAGDRLRAKFGFAFVEVSPINYFAGPEAGKTYVTIDLVDVGDEARLRFKPDPTGKSEDPTGLIAAFDAYNERAWKLLRAGELKKTGQCKGGFHCALGFGHPDLEPREDRFITDVPKHFATLRTALVSDSDGKHRATAAYLLAYGTDRDEVMAALLPAIRDSSSVVRNNVMRVLLMLQQKAPADVLPLEPFLEAMSFPLTSDRNKAAFALHELVKRNPDRYRTRVIEAIGDQLVTMTGMTQPNNRDPAVMILEVLSGEKHGNDPAAWRAWVDGQRAAMKKAGTKANAKKAKRAH